MFLLVAAYPGCPGQTAVKWLLLLSWYAVICIASFHILEKKLTLKNDGVESGEGVQPPSQYNEIKNMG